MKTGSTFFWLGVAASLVATGCAGTAILDDEPSGPNAGAAVSQSRVGDSHAAKSSPRAGSEVVAIAEKMVGAPYRYGGSTPKGFDCSGLVQYSFTKAGHPVPRETGSLFAKSRRVDPSELMPGDLLFFRIEGKVSHVGIYVDGDRFVHAPSSGKKVGYASLNNPYWKARLIKAGRI